jgi:hypothetical protein
MYFSEEQIKFFDEKLKLSTDIKTKVQSWTNKRTNGPVYYLPDVRNIVLGSVNLNSNLKNIILNALKRIAEWNKTFIYESTCPDCSVCIKLNYTTIALQRYTQMLENRLVIMFYSK